MTQTSTQLTDLKINRLTYAQYQEAEAQGLINPNEQYFIKDKNVVFQGDNITTLTNNAGYITKDVSNLTNYTKTSDLATVATTGSYNDLTNKPTIPTKTSDLTNDSSYQNATQVSTAITTVTDPMQETLTSLENTINSYGDIVAYNAEDFYLSSNPDDYQSGSQVSATVSAYHDSTKENVSNKVTSISSSSTDAQYPSAKCVYTIVGNIETLLNNINSGTGS